MKAETLLLTVTRLSECRREAAKGNCYEGQQDATIDWCAIPFQRRHKSLHRLLRAGHCRLVAIKSKWPVTRYIPRRPHQSCRAVSAAGFPCGRSRLSRCSSPSRWGRMSGCHRCRPATLWAASANGSSGPARTCLFVLAPSVRKVHLLHLAQFSC